MPSHLIIHPVIPFALTLLLTPLALANPFSSPKTSPKTSSENKKQITSTPNSNSNSPSKDLSSLSASLTTAATQYLQLHRDEIEASREALQLPANIPLDQLTLLPPIPVSTLKTTLLQNPNFSLSNPKALELLSTSPSQYWIPVQLQNHLVSFIIIQKNNQNSYEAITFGFPQFARGLEPILELHQSKNSLSILITEDPPLAFLHIQTQSPPSSPSSPSIPNQTLPALFPLPIDPEIGIKLALSPTPVAQTLEQIKSLLPPSPLPLPK